MQKNKKILFYSHDTFGLGHIRRTQKIANSVARSDRSILIACASPKASAFASEPGIEYLNLPGFTKQVSGEYLPRSLNIPTDQFVNLRSSLLLSAVRSFAPDLVIIDKEPLGVKKELLPALEYLKKIHKHNRIVCGFRDILDEKPAVNKEWIRRDTEHALTEFFDDILVYGEKNIFDFAHEYDLNSELAERIRYTGYISPKNMNESEFVLPQTLQGKSLPLVTFTLGGGGDGWEFLEVYLDLLEKNLHKGKFRTYILTGPFCHPNLFKKAKEVAQKVADVFVEEFVTNAPSLFRQSDVVISMGGYNTFAELVGMQKYPLILPRVVPRKEQLIRAEVFKRQNLCDYLHPDQIDANSLVDKIKSMLTQTKKGFRPDVFPTRGLDEIRNIFDEWLKT